MNKFINFVKEYQAGKISAFDLYRNLPGDMQKSIDRAMSKGKSEEKETGSDTGKRDPDDDLGDDIHGDDKADLNKQMPGAQPPVGGGGGGVADSPNQTSPSGLALSLDNFVGSRAQLKKSVKAQENYIASQYGIATVRKSGVGSTCIMCNKLYKSVGTMCDSCSSAMQSTTWHKDSHLE